MSNDSKNQKAKSNKTEVSTKRSRKTMKPSKSKSTSQSLESSSESPELSSNYSLIAQGTYGCVINPPIYKKEQIIKSILPYHNKHSTDISKIYKDGETEFKDEYSLLRKVKQIDPQNQFTTKLKGAMILNGNTIDNPRLNNCLTKENQNESSKTYYQIVLENGGVQTNKTYKLTYYEYLQKLKVFLKGMTKLQSKRFVHMDIKPENVLISDKKINLIDFGLMTTSDLLFTYENRKALGYLEYPYYPPEFYLAYMYIKYGQILNDGLEKLFNQYFVVQNNLQERYHTGVSEFMNYMYMNISQGKSNIDDLFTEEIAMKADVFSISFIIHALNKNLQQTEELNYEQKVFINNLHNRCFEINPLKRISMKDLLKIVSDEEEKYSSSKSGSLVSLSDSSSSSLNVSIGGVKKMKRISCAKIPMRLLKVQMNPELKQEMRKSRHNILFKKRTPKID